MGLLDFKYKMFSALALQYGQFQAPVMQIASGGSTVLSLLASAISSQTGGLTTDGVTVTLNRNEASSASFRLVNVYDVQKRRFQEMLTVGSKISVSLGYGTALKKIFEGYVESLEYEFSDNPAVTVRAYDIVQVMSGGGDKNVTWADGERYSDTIQEIMKNYKACSFPATNITPTITTHGQISQTKNDYDFIKRTLCKMCDRDFIVTGGEAYLVNAYSGFGKVTELGYGEGLTSLSVQSSYKNLEVHVTGSVLESAYAVSKGQAGYSLQGKKEERKEKVPLKTKKECQTYADRIVNDELSESYTVSASCVGLPDITPGVGVGFQGIDPTLTAGTFYVKSATHSFGASGYTTSFEATKGK